MNLRLTDSSEASKRRPTNVVFATIDNKQTSKRANEQTNKRIVDFHSNIANKESQVILQT